MIRLGISVEGDTEEAFVKEILANHLWSFGVESVPVLIGRARNTRGGGNVTVARLVSDMVDLHRSFDAVTSLVDFYGFRDKKERSVEELEKHLAQEIIRIIPNAWRIFPYVQKHEFEGLLFSDTAAFREIEHLAEHDITALTEIRRTFPTPEDINDDPKGAPSKRIKSTVKKYRKVSHGLRVARKVGLAKIREECPRFRKWLEDLEGLNSA